MSWRVTPPPLYPLTDLATPPLPCGSDGLVVRCVSLNLNGYTDSLISERVWESGWVFLIMTGGREEVWSGVKIFPHP